MKYYLFRKVDRSDPAKLHTTYTVQFARSLAEACRTRRLYHPWECVAEADHPTWELTTLRDPWIESLYARVTAAEDALREIAAPTPIENAVPDLTRVRDIANRYQKFTLPMIMALRPTY